MQPLPRSPTRRAKEVSLAASANFALNIQKFFDDLRLLEKEGAGNVSLEQVVFGYKFHSSAEKVRYLEGITRDYPELQTLESITNRMGALQSRGDASYVKEMCKLLQLPEVFTSPFERLVIAHPFISRSYWCLYDLGFQQIQRVVAGIDGYVSIPQDSAGSTGLAQALTVLRCFLMNNRIPRDTLDPSSPESEKLDPLWGKGCFARMKGYTLLSKWLDNWLTAAEQDHLNDPSKDMAPVAECLVELVRCIGAAADGLTLSENDDTRAAVKPCLLELATTETTTGLFKLVSSYPWGGMRLRAAALGTLAILLGHNQDYSVPSVVACPIALQPLSIRCYLVQAEDLLKRLHRGDTTQVPPIACYYHIPDFSSIVVNIMLALSQIIRYQLLDRALADTSR